MWPRLKNTRSPRATALSRLAAALLTASLLAWSLAVGHMVEIGAICGQTQPHCLWCPVGAGLGIAGLVALCAALLAAATD